MDAMLIADSGSTKCEWCYIHQGKKKIVETPGISPYFLDEAQVADVIRDYLLPAFPAMKPAFIFFYGTGCGAPVNRKRIRQALGMIFPTAKSGCAR